MGYDEALSFQLVEEPDGTLIVYANICVRLQSSRMIGGWSYIQDTPNMVMLNPFQDHSAYNRWCTRNSVLLAATMREMLPLPQTPWKDLNGAWPLMQGLSKNMIYRSPSPCITCGRMTYSCGERHCVSSDILGGSIATGAGISNRYKARSASPMKKISSNVINVMI